MARPTRLVSVPPMPGTEHLIVDLQVGHEAISGSVKVPSGDQAVFEGWLGLISIIERIQANLDGQEARGVNASDSPPDDQIRPTHEPERGPS
jgi:hypothetical protein